MSSRSDTTASGPDGPLHPADAWEGVRQLAMIWGIPVAEARARLLDNLRVLSKTGPDHTRARIEPGQRATA